MINLLCVLCSLCLQFGAVDFPIDIITQNANHEVFTQTVVSNFNSTYNKSIDYKRVIITRRNNNTYPYYLWIPIELYDSNTTSSITCNSRTDTYCAVTNVGWIRYQVMSNATVPTSTSPNTTSSIGNLYYSDAVVNNGLIYNGYYTLPVGGVDTFIVEEDIQTDIIMGVPLGTLSGGGHSSGGSPLDTLGGVSWSSMTGHSSGGSVAPSPHSSSTHFNSTTLAPDTNDSKTDNLLYMIGNKLADITENTSAVVSALGGVMYNIIEGASAIFNGISVFNDNVNSFFSYLTSVPTSQDIIDALDECENIGSLRDLSNSINIWSELGLTQVNSAPTYTFNFAGTMFDSMGNFVLNFNFLDSTKNMWQPLLIALLYFNLLVTILTGLPDLVQGRGGT